MKPIALLMLVPLLAACKAEFRSPGNADGNMTMEGDAQGQVSFDLPFVKGQVKVPASMMKNGEFDIDGVKMIPGGSLTGFSVFAADKGSTVNIGFKSPASPAETRAYFVNEFRKKGVEAGVAGDSVTGKSKDGNPFRIEISPAANGSQGRIEIQDRD